MVWGGTAHGVKLLLIFIEGNLTAVRYRDEIFRRVAVRVVQQCQLIFSRTKPSHM